MFARVGGFVGVALRGLANALTGNYFNRIEQRLTEIEKRLPQRSAIDRNSAIVQALLDRNQERILNEFEKERLSK